jgi:hypothetical protein
MRHKSKQQFQWAPSSGYTLTEDAKGVSKLNDTIYGSNWNHPIYSTERLHDKITYIELRIKERGNILFFGVSKTNKVRDATFMDPSSCICIYADATSLGSQCVTVVEDCSVRPNDVLGLVVDKVEETITFYKNGKTIARGTRKPSQMEPMYLIMWLYYGNATVELCEQFPLDSLK